MVATLVGDQNYVIPDSYLASCCPSFATSLRALSNWNISCGHGAGFVGRDEAIDTLDLLVSGGVSLQDSTGKGRLFSKVEDINMLRDEPDYVSLTGTVVTIEHTCLEEELIPFVTNSDWGIYKFLKADISARYPGWEKRWHHGVTLALNRYELIPQVFIGKTVCDSSIEVNNIEFD